MAAAIDIPEPCDQDTRLHALVSYSYSSDAAVLSLLQAAAGAGVAARNAFGRTPLHLAVKCAYFFGINALLSAGADVNARDGNGETALHMAAALPAFAADASALLLEAGADASIADNAGDTPLHAAAAASNASSIALLLQAGAVLDQRAWNGDTALHMAVDAGSAEAVQALCMANAALDIPGSDGLTARRRAEAADFPQKGIAQAIGRFELARRSLLVHSATARSASAPAAAAAAAGPGRTAIGAAPSAPPSAASSSVGGALVAGGPIPVGMPAAAARAARAAKAHRAMSGASRSGSSNAGSLPSDAFVATGDAVLAGAAAAMQRGRSVLGASAAAVAALVLPPALTTAIGMDNVVSRPTVNLGGGSPIGTNDAAHPQSSPLESDVSDSGHESADSAAGSRSRHFAPPRSPLSYGAGTDARAPPPRAAGLPLSAKAMPPPATAASFLATVASRSQQPLHQNYSARSDASSVVSFSEYDSSANDSPLASPRSAMASNNNHHLSATESSPGRSTGFAGPSAMTGPTAAVTSQLPPALRDGGSGGAHLLRLPRGASSASFDSGRSSESSTSAGALLQQRQQENIGLLQRELQQQGQQQRQGQQQQQQPGVTGIASRVPLPPPGLPPPTVSVYALPRTRVSFAPPPVPHGGHATDDESGSALFHCPQMSATLQDPPMSQGTTDRRKRFAYVEAPTQMQRPAAPVLASGFDLQAATAAAIAPASDATTLRRFLLSAAAEIAALQSAATAHTGAAANAQDRSESAALRDRIIELREEARGLRAMNDMLQAELEEAQETITELANEAGRGRISDQYPGSKELSIADRRAMLDTQRICIDAVGISTLATDAVVSSPSDGNRDDSGPQTPRVPRPRPPPPLDSSDAMLGAPGDTEAGAVNAAGRALNQEALAEAEAEATDSASSSVSARHLQAWSMFFSRAALQKQEEAEAVAGVDTSSPEEAKAASVAPYCDGDGTLAHAAERDAGSSASTSTTELRALDSGVVINGRFFSNDSAYFSDAAVASSAARAPGLPSIDDALDDASFQPLDGGDAVPSATPSTPSAETGNVSRAFEGSGGGDPFGGLRLDAAAADAEASEEGVHGASLQLSSGTTTAADADVEGAFAELRLARGSLFSCSAATTSPATAVSTPAASTGGGSGPAGGMISESAWRVAFPVAASGGAQLQLLGPEAQL